MALEKTFIELISEDIRAKKELSSLEQNYVISKVKLFLDKKPKIKQEVENIKNYSQFKRSKAYKEIIKSIRSSLREIYGVFMLKGHDKKQSLLKELSKNQGLEIHNEILSMHQSTKERLTYYEYVYKKIFESIGKPKKIVDLACGLNPLSYPYLGYKPEYFACDLSKQDMDFINEYFKVMKIKGEAIAIDLLIIEPEKLKKITEEAGTVFLFKALDSLESIKRNSSKELLASIKSETIIVSFATKSLGGRKNIRKEKRHWFEKLTAKIGFSFKTIEIPGEIFYVLER